MRTAKPESLHAALSAAAATALSNWGSPIKSRDENRLPGRICLDGAWDLTLGEKSPPLQGHVPGCWEADGVDARLIGPVIYARSVLLPQAWLATEAERLWLQCDAVSYACAVMVNDVPLGQHLGLWDAFALEIPRTSLPASLQDTLTVALSVEKPGGTYGVRETLSGFLPYVWGTWGGPWQSVWLRRTGPCAIHALRSRARADGRLTADVHIDLAAGRRAEIRVSIHDAAGNEVASIKKAVTTSGLVAAELSAPVPCLWSPQDPHLYTVVAVAVVDGQVSDIAEQKAGFRDVRIDGTRLTLNGEPLSLRAPLTWGWYADGYAPSPAPDVVRQEFARARALGYNAMKLCLWVPPPSYFEIADEMGMLLWLELPVWAHEGTEFAQKQDLAEIARLIDQRRSHPSVVVWTLGCEIGGGLDSAFLGRLYAMAQEKTQSPLIRDNSGSAECYGGPLPEHADFWDFHFYCDLPFFRETLAAFAPEWRRPQPWLFGEFCDQDSARDWEGLRQVHGGRLPWWALKDDRRNPQGVRWEYNIVDLPDRLEQARLKPRAQELADGSRHQALITRKATMEVVRSLPFISGYVVTGWADTPISTAGMIDDLGALKFSPDEWQPFNGDSVLFIAPDRRRDWVNGGDRPSFVDRYNVWAGATVRRHLGLSHFGRAYGEVAAEWRVTRADGTAWAGGTIPCRVPIEPGKIREIGLLEFDAPVVSAPERMTLSVIARIGGTEAARNEWPLWVYSKPGRLPKPLGLFDPLRALDLERAGLSPVLAVGPELSPESPEVVIASVWDERLRDFVAAGGNLLLAQGQSQGLPAEGLPFWREAMKLVDPHPAWGDFPNRSGGGTDLNYYSLMPDCALKPDEAAQSLGDAARIVSLLTRVDARSYQVHAYALAAEIGGGRMIATTLRLQGGLGDQASGLWRHVAGQYLLHQWLDWLAERLSPATS